MKKFIIAFVAVTSLTSFAKAPVISCELSYEQLASNGATLENKISEVQNILLNQKQTLTNNGFQAEVNLEQVCASASGGPGPIPCLDSYHLNITLSNGENYAHTSVGTPINFNPNLNLKLGNERGWVLCFVQQ